MGQNCVQLGEVGLCAGRDDLFSHGAAESAVGTGEYGLPAPLIPAGQHL